jgi:hypothetical protein
MGLVGYSLIWLFRRRRSLGRATVHGTVTVLLLEPEPVSVIIITFHFNNVIDTELKTCTTIMQVIN